MPFPRVTTNTGTYHRPAAGDEDTAHSAHGLLERSGSVHCPGCVGAALSEGNSVAALRQKGEGSDFAVSQVFVVIDYAKFVDPKRAAEIADQVVEDVLGSQQAQEGGRIAYPGQRRLEVREENLRLGIPVHERVWRKILSL